MTSNDIHMTTATSSISTLTTSAATAAGLAAMDALIASIERSSDPDWRHEMDFVDLAHDPIKEIQRMQRTAPTPMAGAWLAGVLAQRETNHPVLSLADIRTLLAIGGTPATRAFYAGQLMLALQTQVH